MAQTYEELKKKNVADLRKIAKETDHEAVKGYTQMNKERLLEALCAALKIETHAHHEVVGINKKEIKSEIQALKSARDKALEEKNKTDHKTAIRKIHHLKRALRRATV